MKRDLLNEKLLNNLQNIIIDVEFVVDQKLISEILVFVEFVLENMLEIELLCDLKKLVGNFFLVICLLYYIYYT